MLSDEKWYSSQKRYPSNVKTRQSFPCMVVYRAFARFSSNFKETFTCDPARPHGGFWRALRVAIARKWNWYHQVAASLQFNVLKASDKTVILHNRGLRHPRPCNTFWIEIFAVSVLENEILAARMCLSFDKKSHISEEFFKGSFRRLNRTICLFWKTR